MGLDAVEILMEVEEAFDITLEDALAEKILTPGDLIECVLNKVGRADASSCLTQRAFNLSRAALLRRLPLKLRDIAPAVRLADLVPEKSGRQPLLEQLTADLGTRPLPALVLPRCLVWLQTAGCTAGGLGFALLLSHWAPTVKVGSLFIAGSIAALVAVYLAQFVVGGWYTEFPPAATTVGDLACWIMAHKTDLAGPAPGRWTREQVAARIREIVIQQLNCASTYREDASFIQDLGVS
jgi:acyl carrier protein